MRPKFEYEFTSANRAVAVLNEAKRMYAVATHPSVVKSRSIVYGCVDLILLTNASEDETRLHHLDPIVINNDLDMLMTQPNLNHRNAQELRIKKNSNQTTFSVQFEPIAAISMVNSMRWAHKKVCGPPPLPLSHMTTLTENKIGLFIDGYPLDLATDIDRAIPDEPDVFTRLESITSATRICPIQLV